MPRLRGVARPALLRSPTPAVLAQSFFMPRGYTMVWSGWHKAAGTNNANYNSTIALPVARNADGTSITGPSYEYIVSPGGRR